MYTIFLCFFVFFLGYLLLCKRIDAICAAIEAKGGLVNNVKGNLALDSTILMLLFWVVMAGVFTFTMIYMHSFSIIKVVFDSGISLLHLSISYFVSWWL